mmetsp:Transcript_394/g.712  ORF Transcript_394/g.712 Transcript_394/m.712 type:complete len:322 (-) Transcript_394:1302-2267(-)|eukprot:CAMPEP_0203764390 /NCGR_PEP_ID=MMETSP0098-20131031/17657_1 /ASSEMBLY_ACC=CAM_ASM_000208 /TAXON_ID=96639 /ORGANISM=" , Strain NY0313808BC1" /LENGTH=321 /DNA_ID=CAMNT_0050660231 /DNA_START=50 /DNA_END=1015 /DNA_ORIENTATION=-
MKLKILVIVTCLLVGAHGGPGKGHKGLKDHIDGKGKGNSTLKGNSTDEDHFGKSKKFAPKGLDFCKIKPEKNSSSIDVPATDNETSADEGRRPGKRAQRVVNTIRFFCANELRTLCQFGPQDEEKQTCPELFMTHCSHCFVSDSSRLNRTCLCECQSSEDNKEALANCTKPEKPDTNETDTDEGGINGNETETIARKDHKGGKKKLSGQDKAKMKSVAKMLHKTAVCFATNILSLSDTCKGALSDLMKKNSDSDSEEQPDDGENEDQDDGEELPDDNNSFNIITDAANAYDTEAEDGDENSGAQLRIHYLAFILFALQALL